MTIPGRSSVYHGHRRGRLIPREQARSQPHGRVCKRLVVCGEDHKTNGRHGEREGKFGRPDFGSSKAPTLLIARSTGARDADENG
jgi:hypothetical protein